MACCKRAHSAFCASAMSALKATIEAASAAKAPTDARNPPCPKALRMRVLAVLISSIVLAHREPGIPLRRRYRASAFRDRHRGVSKACAPEVARGLLRVFGARCQRLGALPAACGFSRPDRA